jgi:hypothetical protein
MEFSTSYRRRLWLFCVALVFASLGMGIAFHSLRRHAELSREYLDIAVAEKDARAELNRLIQLVSLIEGVAMAEPREALLARAREYVEESTEALHELAASLRELQIEEESADLLRGVEHLEAVSIAVSSEPQAAPFLARLLDLGNDAQTLLDDVDRSGGIALGTARERVAWQSRVAQAGFSLGVAGLAVCVIAMLLVLIEILNDALAPRDIQEELCDAAKLQGVTARLDHLAAMRHGANAGSGAPESGPWSIELSRVMRERRTHLVFEATAVRGTQELSLWGRRYRWAGILKSLQHLPVARGFDAGSWDALHALWRHGLEPPVPIAFVRLRVQRIPVGSLLLTEHIGEVRSVRRFVRYELALLPIDARCAFLERLGRFVREIHAAGVVGISIRGLQGTALATDTPRFVLCELDKAHPTLGRYPRIASWLRRGDRKRILAALAPHLARPEQERLTKALDPPPAVG